jgi:hypothetical protein
MRVAEDRVGDQRIDAVLKHSAGEDGRRCATMHRLARSGESERAQGKQASGHAAKLPPAGSRVKQTFVALFRLDDGVL